LKPALEPRDLIDMGKRVLFTHPSNDLWSLEGEVTGKYGDDRMLVTTDSGRTWALKIDNLTVVEVACLRP
jgi:photosystem II stability/assembly factor-like uncharacterized protein